MSDMDDSESGGSTDIQGLGRPDKPLGRGLEDVSHLFLSHRTDEAAANDRAVVRSNEPASPPPPSRAGVTLLRPASVTKDWLTIVLTEFDDAVEEGLRTIDASIPCHPCGEIDLLAPQLIPRLCATSRWVRPRRHFCRRISRVWRMDSRSVAIHPPFGGRTVRSTPASLPFG